MDWDEFMQKRPTDPVFMRVFMEPAPSASADFPDTNYLCVKLTNPLNPASPPIYGYVGRDSALEKSLNSDTAPLRRRAVFREADAEASSSGSEHHGQK